MCAIWLESELGEQVERWACNVELGRISPMTTAEAIAKLKALDLSEFGVRSLELFGSTARGEASESSDLEILVELEGKVEFVRYAKLWNYLEDTLGVKVDLVLKNSLRPELRPDVEREAIGVS